MYVFTKPARLLGGLTLLALCGCHTYSPYGYGSGYGHPPAGTYSAPPSYYAPGGTVVPGTVVPNRGGTYSPGKQSPGGTGSTSGTGAGVVPEGKSPMFEAKRGAGGLLPNEKPVPDPKVPDSAFPGDSKDSGPAKSGAKADPMASGSTTGAGAFVPSDKSRDGSSQAKTDGIPTASSPFSGSAASGSSSASPSRIKLTGSGKEDDPQEPARFQPPKSASPITPAASGAPAKGGSSTIIDPTGSKPMSRAAGLPNPFDYDRQNYAWLRGKVDFDEGTKTWQIIYSLDGKDKYGGSLTLADNPLLKKLKNDDVALVEGRVDESRKTGRGKPVYRIDYLFAPLVPRASLSPAGGTRNSVVTSAR